MSDSENRACHPFLVMCKGSGSAHPQYWWFDIHTSWFHASSVGSLFAHPSTDDTGYSANSAWRKSIECVGGILDDLFHRNDLMTIKFIKHGPFVKQVGGRTIKGAFVNNWEGSLLYLDWRRIIIKSDNLIFVQSLFIFGNNNIFFIHCLWLHMTLVQILKVS